jgi:hypothetical protein
MNISEFSKLTGLHTKTLQRWDREGKLRPSGRSKTNRRIYEMEQAEEAIRLNGAAHGELLGLTRTEHRMVDPVVLNIDNEWDCDPVNLSFLEYSIRKSGFTQSVYVWLPIDYGATDNPRVIDGLHRTLAARKIGIQAIPADVFIGSEEDFWSHRINSALKHHVVKKERLGAFISECWRASGLFQPITAERMIKDYRRFGHKISAEITEDTISRYSAARAVWESDFATHRLGSDSVERRRSVDQKVKEWFIEKAALWGIPEADIKVRLLTALGFPVPLSSKSQAVSAALYRNAAITFADHVAIIEQVSKAGPSVKPEVIQEWVDDVIEEKPGAPVSLTDYLKALEESERERKAREIEERRLRAQRSAAAAVTPAGKHREEKDRLAMFRGQARSVQSVIGGLRHYLTSPSAEYIDDASRIAREINETFKIIPGWIPDDLTAIRSEIVTLKDENEKLREEIELLRSGRKSATPIVRADQLALSSDQLESSGLNSAFA